MSVRTLVGAILGMFLSNFVYADIVCQPMESELTIEADKLDQLKFFIPANIAVKSNGRLVSQRLAVSTGTKSRQEFRYVLKNGVQTRQLHNIHLTTFPVDLGGGMRLATLEEARSVMNDVSTKVFVDELEFVCEDK